MATTAAAPITLGVPDGGPISRVYVTQPHPDLPAGKVVHVQGSDVDALLDAGTLTLI